MTRRHVDTLSDLGSLPFSVSFPTAPTISSEVSVSTQSAFDTEAAAGQSQKRIRVTSTITSQVTIGGTDFEVVLDDGVSLDGGIFLDQSVARVHLNGGTYGDLIDIVIPFDFGAGEEKPEWQVQDVRIEDVDVTNMAGNGINARGARIAILDSKVRTNAYAVWGGNGTATLPNDQVIIGGCDLHSTGDQATIRFVNATNMVTMHNVLANDLKHCYRVHQTSSNHYAKHNVFIDAGVLMGGTGEDVDEGWFLENTFYHTLPDLFNINSDGSVTNFRAQDNTAHSDEVMEFYSGTEHASWDFSNNQLLAYQAPPSDVRDFEVLAVRRSNSLRRRSRMRGWRR